MQLKQARLLQISGKGAAVEQFPSCPNRLLLCKGARINPFARCPTRQARR